MTEEKIEKKVEFDISIEKTTVTANFEEVFSPVQYNSFRVGASMTTEVRAGETPYDALLRAQDNLFEFAKNTFEERLSNFFAHYREAMSEQTTSTAFDQARGDNSAFDRAKSNDNKPQTAASPIARSLSDLVTAKQLGMIRGTAREKNLDADEECRKIFPECICDELSKKAASTLIDHLLSLPAWTDPQQPLLNAPNGSKSSEAKIVEEKLEAKDERRAPITQADDDIPF